MRYGVALLLTLCLVGAPAQADDHLESLSKHFRDFELRIDAYLEALWLRRYDVAEREVSRLTQHAVLLRRLGEDSGNESWDYYASNVFNHTLELLDSTKRQDGVEAIYLTAILLNHLGEIEASSPEWLRFHLKKQLSILDQGIAAHDASMVRDAAEIIHSSAQNIMLSAATSGHVYRHTRWTESIVQINGLGDQIINQVNRGEWGSVPELRNQIVKLVARWEGAFKV